MTILQSTILRKLTAWAHFSYFKKYIGDWILVLSLTAASAYLEFYTEPFNRHFNVYDPTINFPFATKEQFDSTRLFRYAITIPLAVFTAVHVFKFIKNQQRNNNDNNNNDTNAEWILKAFHNYHILLLSFMIGLALNGLITEFLKNLISKPRPDFIERCGVNYDLLIPKKVNYDSSICTKPLGQALYKDGFKSSPSGHSSFAFTGLGYLSLWLTGQLKLFSKGDSSNTSNATRSQYKPVYMRLIPLIPILVACKIAISRTQDYRHHFKDILLGSLFGIINCTVNYFWFFNRLDDKRSDQLIHEDDHKLLSNAVAYQLESREADSLV